MADKLIEVPGYGQVAFPEGMSDDAISNAIKNNMMKSSAESPVNSPSNLRVALNASSKGIAAVPDALLNTPTNILNLLKAGYGTAATASGRPDLAPEISNPPNYINNLFRRIGAIGQGGEPVTAGQRVLDSAVQTGVGMAMTPASSINQMGGNIVSGLLGGTASGGTKEATGSDTAAMAVGLLAPSAINAAGNYGRNKINDLETKKSANSVRDQTLANARAEGYVIPPTQTNPSFLNNRLESIAGKAAIKQESAHRNQEVTNRIAANELGLPAGTSINEGVLEKFRNSASAPYQEIRNISPVANSAVDRLRDTRTDLRVAWKDYGRNQRTETYKEIQVLEARKQALENAIEKMATKVGSPDLLNNLREARTQIAKSYDIERALNLGDAGVSAPAIGRALDRGAQLSGGLETIGKFAQGPGRQFVAEGSSVPSPGVSGTEYLGMAGLGAAGQAALGPAGVTAALLPLMRGPVRSLLLSNMYQNSLGSPNYSAGILANAASRLPKSNGLSPFMMTNPQVQGLLQR